MPHFSSNTFRLAVFDLDDTLLGPDKSISDENIEALNRLRSVGVEVVIASGRHNDDIAIFEEYLGIQGWVISAGGASVRHAKTSELLYEATICRNLAIELLNTGLDLDMRIIGHHRSGIFCNRLPHCKHLYSVRTKPLSIEEIHLLIESGVQKLIWTCVAQTIERLTPKMEIHYEGQLYVVNTEREMLEFLHPRADKGMATQALAKRLGISREQVIAFGDGNNDVPLLRWAGMSVAMAHGRESAKAAAKRVTQAGPPETAVARAVEALLD